MYQKLAIGFKTFSKPTNKKDSDFFIELSV